MFVDNSIIEVYANDEVAISTRAYPWLSNSTGAGFISQIGGNDTVTVKDVELWDGLVRSVLFRRWFSTLPVSNLTLFLFSCWVFSFAW